MLLSNNTERVMDLIDMVDELKGIDKIRLAIHLLENLIFLLIMMKDLLNY